MDTGQLIPAFSQVHPRAAALEKGRASCWIEHSLSGAQVVGEVLTIGTVAYNVVALSRTCLSNPSINLAARTGKWKVSFICHRESSRPAGCSLAHLPQPSNRCPQIEFADIRADIENIVGVGHLHASARAAVRQEYPQLRTCPDRDRPHVTAASPYSCSCIQTTKHG